MEWKSATTKEDGTVSIPERWLHLHYYEALNILFRMENALRIFVYVVLKNNFKEKWAEAALQTVDEEQSTIAATASRRMAQARGYGYLGYEITSPLMYLNSGELTRLIVSDSYWELFKPFFRGRREIIKTKFDEIGMVRNALAHFRPLKYDDIEMIKQNVKHAFVGIEQFITEITHASLIVPTNTNEDWYKALSTSGSNLCGIRIFQNKTGNSVSIELGYSSVVLRYSGNANYRSFRLTNLSSPELLKRFPKITRHCLFMTEGISHTQITETNAPKFVKKISLVFSRNTIVEHYKEIDGQLRAILLVIESETELLQKDNLARGELVDSSHVWCSPKRSGETTWWAAEMEEMKSPFAENDPPEYWGDLTISSDDFIAGSTQYPWMPSDISKSDTILVLRCNVLVSHNTLLLSLTFSASR